MSQPSNALTSLYLTEPTWNTDRRYWSIDIRTLEDHRIVGTESHTFLFKVFERALAKARRIEAEASNSPVSGLPSPVSP